MRWWSRLPLASLVLLAGTIGIIQLREEAGTEAGYLMAGACLVLSGVFSCMEILRYKDDREERERKKPPGEEDEEER